MSYTQRSFLRAEDWAPLTQFHHNPYWGEILRIIDEFEKLLDTQTKEIKECIQELTNKRVELVQKFYQYKTSLQFQNEIKVDKTVVYDNDSAKAFFHGYYAQIDEIVRKVGLNPKGFAKIISKTRLKKLESLEFTQNILSNLYPSYLPAQFSPGQPNNCLEFLEDIINCWDYSMETAHPRAYTVIDQIINGINKSPEIVCYVQRISMQFMRQLNKCKMNTFAFDEDALRHEMEVKKMMTASSYSENQRKKSKWNSFKSFFKKEKQGSEQGYLSHTSETMDPQEIEFDFRQIMKTRQENFFKVVKKTIEAILQEQTPYLLNQMMKFFHRKLVALVEQDSINASIYQSVQQAESFKSASIEGGSSTTFSRHYTYFMMTNLIFEEIHNKFISNHIHSIVSHEDEGMNAADLQNITEIIRIMSNVFQGVMPKGEKYKNEKMISQLKAYLPKIEQFYARILIQAEDDSEDQKQSHNNEIRRVLLHLHENNMILSFNDIRSIVHLIKESPAASTLELSPKAQAMKFLESETVNNIFDLSNKKVIFKNKSHNADRILFVFNSKEPTLAQIIKYYTGNESALKNLPVLTNALMYGSNLSVSESLQVTKSLNLIEDIPLKQIKYYLSKISTKYHHLYLKNSDCITGKLRETLSQHLHKNIERKATLLMHRQEICSRISGTERLLVYYTQYLQSSQLYDRISESFIRNLKFKVYMRIQNDQLKIYDNVKALKGMHLKSVLMSDSEGKNKNYNEEYLLRNYFKIYHTIQQVLHSIIQNNITRTALNNGRRVDQFNKAFCQLCDIVVSHIEEFMSKREILQNLNKQKLAHLIVSRLQAQIYNKCKNQNINTQDLTLKLNRNVINVDQFYDKDLKELKVDWSFLVEEGTRKFLVMARTNSISDRLRQFNELFEIIFTIIGFTMDKNKISGDIINPIIQYLILKTTLNSHFECLYSLQCLKWTSSPEVTYKLQLYETSLIYVSEMMVKDYPLPPKQRMTTPYH